MESSDIYAYTNPIFLTLNMNEFLLGYEEKKKKCFFPMLYLVAPIILSNKINKYFLNTNKKTEFINLLYKHPEIKVIVPQMIEKTKKYSNSAIIFGSQIGFFIIDNNGYVSTKTNKYKTNKYKKNNTYLKYSRRLGQWLAEVDESQVFLHLGVTL